MKEAGREGGRLEHKKNIFIKMNDFVLARPNGRRFVGGPPIPSSPPRLFPLRCCFACSCMCTDVSFFLLLRLLDAAGLIKKKKERENPNGTRRKVYFREAAAAAAAAAELMMMRRLFRLLL